jgi:hypothetical protein
VRISAMPARGGNVSTLALPGLGLPLAAGSGCPAAARRTIKSVRMFASCSSKVAPLSRDGEVRTSGQAAAL